ncbi:MAG: hypothetical protein LLG01_04685 [Planctomycetaceae bacterium]|nr:hypothetical protein [Planctomycetaceae bacterium]
MLGHHHHHHDHDHHDHEGPCCHDEPADAGQKHLADALRVFFLVLTFVMVCVVVYFVFSGITTIHPQYRGIKKVFGKAIEPAIAEGLSITWPFPIGEIEKVSIREETVRIDDQFFILENPAEVGKPLSQRRSRSAGLDPAVDGALLTGDQNLLHARLTCKYVVADPIAVRATLPLDLAEPEMSKRQAFNPEILRNIVCAATVKAMASRTGMGFKEDRAGLEKEIAEDAQRRMNVLTVDRAEVDRLVNELKTAIAGKTSADTRTAAEATLQQVVDLWMQGRSNETAPVIDALVKQSGPAGKTVAALAGRLGAAFDHKAIEIKNVLTSEISWPIRTLDAWDNAAKAKDEASRKIIEAQSQAEKMLTDAAGENAQLLVDVSRITERATRGATTQPAPLIDRYIAAIEARKPQEAEALLEQIDRVLVSSGTRGEASRILQRAASARTAIETDVKARVTEFENKLAGYKLSPELTLQRLWAETREKILQGPQTMKFYVPKSDRPLVLYVQTPDDIRRQLEKAARDAAADAAKNKQDQALTPAP